MLIAVFSQYFFGLAISITSLFLILLVLVQRGRGGGLTGALGGAGGQSAFGTKAGDLFTRITVGVAAVWIFLCAAAVYFLKDRELPQTNVLESNNSAAVGALNPAAPPVGATPPAAAPAGASSGLTTQPATGEAPVATPTASEGASGTTPNASATDSAATADPSGSAAADSSSPPTATQQP